MRNSALTLLLICSIFGLSRTANANEKLRLRIGENWGQPAAFNGGQARYVDILILALRSTLSTSAIRNLRFAQTNLSTLQADGLIVPRDHSSSATIRSGNESVRLPSEFSNPLVQMAREFERYYREAKGIDIKGAAITLVACNMHLKICEIEFTAP